MSKVCIFTSAHSPSDQRIFHKQAQTLLSAGYDVTLVAHYDQAETRDGVEIIPVAPSDSELERTIDLFRIYRTAKSLNADVYHFHDPTLLPFGAALSHQTDAKVIYDAHEDYSEVLPFYSMTPEWAGPLINRFWPMFESGLAGQLDGVIGATEYISDFFRDRDHDHVATVHNFPKTTTLTQEDISVNRNSEHVLIFTGGISELRGLPSMLDVTSRLYNDGYDVCLWLLGPVGLDGGTKELERRIQEGGHSAYTRYLGKVDHSKVHSYQRAADVGLVLVPKRIDGKRYYRRGIPTKMIEYMYAELPVVGTDTMGIQNYLPQECGIKVPSRRTSVQADAIRELLDSPQKRSEMGEAGREHVVERMSWENESQTLLEFYQELMK